MEKFEPKVTIELREYNRLKDLEDQFTLYKDKFEKVTKCCYDPEIMKNSNLTYLFVKFEDLEKFTTNLFGGDNLRIRNMEGDN